MYTCSASDQQAHLRVSTSLPMAITNQASKELLAVCLQFVRVQLFMFINIAQI